MLDDHRLFVDSVRSRITSFDTAQPLIIKAPPLRMS